MYVSVFTTPAPCCVLLHCVLCVLQSAGHGVVLLSEIHQYRVAALE